MEDLAVIIVFLLITAHTCSSHTCSPSRIAESSRTAESSRIAESTSFNVVAYGAVGDGKTDDSNAFTKAWTDFCGATGDLPTLIVPAGKEFLLKPISFTGPCKSPRLNIQLQGILVAPSSINAWGNADLGGWIKFSYVTNLIIDGGGKIDGRGQIWWDACKFTVQALSFHQCDGLLLRYLSHVNSPRNHISLGGSTDVRMSHLTITAPDESPNTDGINIARSSHVQIYDSVIGTGDDCIAINGFSSDINISRINCGPGHGISIGSLGKNGVYETVEDIHVTDSKFTGTTNGARIKTWKGGNGYVRRVTFERITLVDAQNPIIIDQNYFDKNSFGQVNPPKSSSDVKISNVLFSQVHGSTTDEKAIVFICGENNGCTNIFVENIKITSTIPGKKLVSVCENGSGIRSKLVMPEITCLQ
ncbi:Probable polygalacturonase At3g15720 [Linum perenne]